jgi:hypothetical protein
VGCLSRRHALAIQWWIGERLFREQQRRYYGGIALSLLKRREPPPDLDIPREFGAAIACAFLGT